MSDADELLLPPGPGPLDVPLAEARITGLTRATATKLGKGLELWTVRDLLEHVPRRYIDLSRTRTLGELKIGEDATTKGRIVRVDGRYLRSRRHMLTVTIGDGSGYVDLIWWNQPFRGRNLRQGMDLIVAGRIERSRKGRRLMISNPFVEQLTGGGVHTGRVIPIHGATAGVSPNQIRRYVYEALNRFADRVGEPLPSALVQEKALPARASALREVHFPTEERSRRAARRRLVYEELFVLSAGLAMRKRRLQRDEAGAELRDERGYLDRFLGSLPFTLTAAQRLAIQEIAVDLGQPHPMNRLLQGEVGSGKTVVAVAAALIAASAGSQTAFMAPTEVLADQHFLTVSRLLEQIGHLAPADTGRLFGEGFRVALLTGSVGGKERQRALEMAASGEAMMLVGTHALIQEGVTFDRLGLAIVDEQHRFGVHQRLSLRAKGKHAQPDVLIMTATPIPRTLALTLYGDLDVSTLDEMPAGRTPVETMVVRDAAGRETAYGHLRAEVAAGRQAFIICPLVEDSATLEAKAAESEYERIRADVFPDLRVGLIHGRMKSQAKDEVMTAMRSGDLDILVSTTVIEVGVDIANATVMVIEDADRFGLSQLHQLRGRVGRGAHRSRCYLFTAIDPEDDDARAEAMRRLDAMAATADGFRLAELDLEIRGAGHLLGRGSVGEGKGAPLQAGRGDLRFANLTRDVEILVEARRDAFAIVDRDPLLAHDEHRALLDEVRRRFADRLDWLFAS